MLYWLKSVRDLHLQNNRLLAKVFKKTLDRIPAEYHSSKPQISIQRLGTNRESLRLLQEAGRL
jgi:hypothetical protein